jgi:hypothetical protein
MNPPGFRTDYERQAWILFASHALSSLVEATSGARHKSYGEVADDAAIFADAMLDEYRARDAIKR